MSYYPILHKLQKTNTEQTLQAISEHYCKNQTACINFLYFSNTMKRRLCETGKEEEKKLYKQSLLGGDFLLPDGIAGEVFYYVHSMLDKRLPRTWLSNLNGTDFTPRLLKYFQNKYKSLHIGVVSVYDPKIHKQKDEIYKADQSLRIQFNQGFDFIHQYLYSKRGQGFPRKQYKKSLEKKKSSCAILLVCMGTPMQEIRSYQHRNFFKEQKVIVCNVGGFIDFLSGFETRAPQRVVKTRVMETLWRISNNPKKNRKKFKEMFGIGRYIWKSLTSYKNKK